MQMRLFRSRSKIASSAPNGLPVYTLRGVGFYESSIGAYPSASIYMDEVSLRRHGSCRMDRRS